MSNEFEIEESEDSKFIEIDNIESLVYNMVDWKNPPTVSDLLYDMEQSKSSHEEHIRNVDKYITILRGDLTKFVAENRSRIQVKLARKQSEWKYPSLEDPFLSSLDLFNVNPSTYKDVEGSKQHELILNKQFRTDINRTKLINEYVRSTVNTGTGILKVGWEEKVGLVKEEFEVPVYAETPEERQAFIEQQIQEGVFTPEIGMQLFNSNEPLVVDVVKEIREVEKVYINRPTIEVEDSRNIIIDPTCGGDMDKANFVIKVFTTDLSTLKMDDRYTNLEHINTDLNADDLSNYYSNEDVDDFDFKDDARKKLIAYEYWGFWDIDDSGIVKPIVATFIGNVMIRLAENPFPDKKVPFVIVKHTLPIEFDSPYGEPDAALLEDNQEIMSAITRGVLDMFGNTANAQQGFAKGFMDERNFDRYRKGQDYFFNPTVGGLNNSYIQTKYPDFPKGAFDLLTLQNTEAQELTGSIPFNGGQNGGSTGNSVGGMNITLDASAKRESSILRRLSQGIIDVAKKIIAMNTLWLTDGEIIRITDHEFVTISRATLAVNFDVSITISTAAEDSVKSQQLAFLLQTIGNNTDLGILKILFIKLAELNKMPDLAEAIKQYQPQPDPRQSKMVDLQLALLEAQIEGEKVKSQENLADIERKLRQALTEEAKAKQLNATTDMQDLDFTEQALGVKHERELELLRAKTQLKDSQPKTKPVTKK